jgi:hypothetical protein
MAGEWHGTTLGGVCEFRAGAVFPPVLQGKSIGKLRWRSRKLTHLCSFKWDLSLETIFFFQVGV